MKNQTHEEWVVLVQQKRYPDTWLNAKMWWPDLKCITDKYCKSEEEAKAVLANAYRKWNGAKQYDANGQRYERVDVWSTMVCDKKYDEQMEIVKHRIRKRTVTEWETVDE